MLFNPNWIPETKPADVFSLESLIAWLETMPADGKYDYDSPCNCLIDQYLRFYGVCTSNYGNVLSLDTRVAIVHRSSGDQTFGAALARARAALIGKERT